MLKNDSNGFPASYQLHLDIPTCDNSNGTMDITYYDHADFIWNADTGVVRCSTSEIKGIFALSFKTYVDLSVPDSITLTTEPCK